MIRVLTALITITGMLFSNNLSAFSVSPISPISFASSVFASDINNIINHELLHQDQIIKKALKDNARFLNKQKNLAQKMQGQKELAEVIKNIKSEHTDRIKASPGIKKAPQAIVFVSFSMPELSLKQIIYDASQYQIPVVIRGLYQNSFRKTFGKIFELVKENNKGGIAINPRWFREYDIKAVPAVVVSEDFGTNETNRADEKNESTGIRIKKNKKSDVVYGNIPLKRALSIIAERGEVRNLARDILNRSNK